MERGQDCCHAVQPRLNVLAALQQGSQLATLREGAHHHHMVDRFAIHHEVGHPEVHVGGQPAIELDFSVTVCGAGTAIPEIQKVEMNGLVELVDPVSEEEKNRDVRLRHPHWCSRELGIRSSSSQSLVDFPATSESRHHVRSLAWHAEVSGIQSSEQGKTPPACR